MVNYSDARIYKIVCNSTGLVYIGSTTNKLLCKRLSQHVDECKKMPEEKKAENILCKIFENKKYSIHLIKECPCKNKDELLIIKQQYLDENKTDIDVCSEYPTKKDNCLNYENGKIYKIVCNTTGLVYIGSTTQELLVRLNSHISKLKSYLLKKHDTNYSSFNVLQGNNYTIHLIELFPCKSKCELLAREEHYINNTECVNKIKAVRTTEEENQYYTEYRNKNKDAIMQQIKQWHIDHKQDVQANKKQYYQENKKAISEKQKIYYEKNKEKLDANHKCYYEANKEILSEKSKEYREANKEMLREKKKAYYEANKEVLNAKKKEYQQKNKEVLKEKKKAYYEKNKEVLNEKKKMYYEKNKEKMTQYKHEWYLANKINNQD